MKEAQKEMAMSRTAVTSFLPFCSPQAQTKSDCSHRTSTAGAPCQSVPLKEQSVLKCRESCTCSSDSSSPISAWGCSCYPMHVIQQPGLLQGQLPSLWRWRVGPKQHPQTSFSKGEFHFQKVAVSPLCQESSVQKTQPHSWHGRYHCAH